jgi:hypothetical protein
MHVYAELSGRPRLRDEQRLRRAVHGLSVGAHVRACDGRVSLRDGVLGIDQQLQGQLRLREHRVRQPVPVQPRVQHDHGQLRLPHDLRHHLLPERDALLPQRRLLHGLWSSERGVQRVLSVEGRHEAKTVVALAR